VDKKKKILSVIKRWGNKGRRKVNQLMRIQNKEKIKETRESLLAMGRLLYETTSFL